MSFFLDQFTVRLLWDLYRNVKQGRNIEDLRRFALESDLEHEVRIATTRWLEVHRALASFGCGIAAVEDRDEPAPTRSSPRGSRSEEWIPPRPDVWDEVAARPVPVTVAVTGEAFVFLREGVPEIEDERVVEVGRFPRASFVSAHLEDARGNRVAAPIIETFEPAAPCGLIVTWRRDDETDDHDTFAFMSLSVAEEAAAKFRRFASSA